MTIGEKILKARKSKGLTGEELGNRVGLSKGAVWKVENDSLKGGPQPELVVKVANALGDNTILLHYLEENPVYRAIIPRIFPDLNNIRRDPAIIFSRFADEAGEAIEAARILSQIFSNANPENTPNFEAVFKANMEQIVDVQRCAEILFVGLIHAGVMTDVDQRVKARRK
jgi:transcriptional regulator with XRE-family HTH domain